jgi:catechol 2,3-dioxygenase-like lactoylglutathione lyase family enzyme
MIRLQDISYVRLGTADLDGATKFATDYLGLEIAHRSKDSVYLKSDLREHTLCYFAGSPTDQTAAFEVAERADLEAAASELDRLGHHVRLGSTKEAELRQVRSFIAFDDPTGNSIELVWRPAYGSRRYHGERDAGITGFSHIGLCTTDAARDEAFWTNVCSAFSAFITKPFQMSLRHRVAPEYASLSAALHPIRRIPSMTFFSPFSLLVTSRVSNDVTPLIGSLCDSTRTVPPWRSYLIR